MSDIRKGRWTARSDEPFALFLIGMRINKPWKVWKWGPVAQAMPRMLAELARKPEMGLLGGDFWVGRTFLSAQYWRSFEHLEAYAHARDSEHLPAWAAFNRARRDNGDVGIFHETYRIAPGDYENVYVDMPAMLLGRAAPVVAATGGLQGARSRLTSGAPPPP